MTEHNVRRTALIGLAVTLGLCLAAWLIGGAKIFQRSYTVSAIFDNASDIEGGDPVRVAGLDVGTVKSLERVADGVSMKLQLQKGTKISERSRATIRLRTLLGKKYVQLEDPGVGPVMKKGGVIPRGRTDPATDLDTVVTSFSSSLQHIDVQSINNLMRSFDKVISGKGDRIGKIMDGLNGLAGTLASRKSDIDRLISAGTRLSAAVDDRRAALGTSLDGMATALDALAARRTELTQMVEGVKGLTQELTPILDRNTGSLDAIVTDVVETSRVLDHQKDRIKLALDQLPEAVYSLVKVTRQGSWINVYNVGFPMSPYFGAPSDVGDANGQEPGQTGGLPRIWLRPPAQAPNANVAGVDVNTDDKQPPPPQGYYDR